MLRPLTVLFCLVSTLLVPFAFRRRWRMVTLGGIEVPRFRGGDYKACWHRHRASAVCCVREGRRCDGLLCVCAACLGKAPVVKHVRQSIGKVAHEHDRLATMLMFLLIFSTRGSGD